MGFCLFAFMVYLAMFFKQFACQDSQQQPNTDGFFVSQFLEKMALGLASSPGYNLSMPVCSWQGVFCDGKREHVIGLVASGLGLSGIIPDTTIGKLTGIQSLDFSNNNITGLPSDFWSLSSLRSLNLSSNRISGTLANNIGNFGLLESLDLSGNDFSGEIPADISSLLSLQVLNLNRNSFGWSIPSGILNCQSLVSIDLSLNRLNGSLPDGFGASFPKLKTLDLASNLISGGGSDLSKLKSITHLNISGNLLQGSVMGVFQGMLKVIDVSRNRFSGDISQVQFSSNYSLSHLVYLDMSENQLEGEISFNLSQFPSLKHFNLAHNRFTEQKFPLIDMSLGLEYLNLSKTSLIGSIPSEISKLSSLNTLDLSENFLTGQIPLLSVRNLKYLDVSHNNLSGEIPLSILKKLRWMEKFNFSLNNLTLCASELSPDTLQTSFYGSVNTCPVAVNPNLLKRRAIKQHKGMKLALSLTLSIFCLLLGMLFLAFGCRRKNRMWAVKHSTCKEEQIISGPFSFQSDSTTWVADVKQATSVPVVIFEKPLLNITFADLLSATSNFDQDTLLAEAKFGTVYKGFLHGGIHVAMKVLVHGSTLTDQEAAREFESLGRIKHPNLVPLVGYCLAGEKRIAIYDYMENGNLKSLLHDFPHGDQTREDWSPDVLEENNITRTQNVVFEGLLSTWRFRHNIALGTARALAFLHHGCSPPIIHRDVKASRIYLDSNLETRLSDFGLAKVFGTGLDEEIYHRSPGYVPPEFCHLQRDSPTPKSDVYCFGVILLELITGKRPVDDDYADENETSLVNWVRGLVRNNKSSLAIDPKFSETALYPQMEEALKIGYLCTADLPSKRPSMHQVVGLLKDIAPVAHK